MTRTTHALLGPTTASALPDLALGVVFLAAWLAPGAFGVPIVPFLMLVMLLEFIIIHSSAFMGAVYLGGRSTRHKLAGILGLGAFYTLFVGAFSLSFGSWWPLASFWGLQLNRMAGMLTGRPPGVDDRRLLAGMWIASCACYLGFVALTSLAPIPKLGLAGFDTETLPVEGLWADEPHRLMAFGFLYFTAVGLTELLSHAWLPAVAALGRPAGRAA